MAGTPKKFDKRNVQRRAEYAQERTLEKLAAFEEIQSTLLPKLAKLLAEGADSAKMRKEMAPYLTARAISIALTDQDTGRALTAIKDLVDREEGKAKERQEVEHKFSKLSDAELDAMLLSNLGAPKPAEDEEVQDSH